MAAQRLILSIFIYSLNIIFIYKAVCVLYVSPLQSVHRFSRSLSSAHLVHSCNNVQAFIICNIVLMKGHRKVRVSHHDSQLTMLIPRYFPGVILWVRVTESPLLLFLMLSADQNNFWTKSSYTARRVTYFSQFHYFKGYQKQLNKTLWLHRALFEIVSACNFSSCDSNIIVNCVQFISQQNPSFNISVFVFCRLLFVNFQTQIKFRVVFHELLSPLQSSHLAFVIVFELN